MGSREPICCFEGETGCLSSLFHVFDSDFFPCGELNDIELVKNFYHLVSRIDLMPADTTEVSTRAVFVVIVVIALSHHEEIKRQEILGGIAYFEISVTILVSKPVDDRAMDGAHQEVNRQQQEKPRARCEQDIE